jgi:hypothetical protein
MVMKLFGKTNPTVGDVVDIAFFLEKAYLHENEHPLIQLLEFEFQDDKKPVLASSEGLNIMYILLNPQQIPPLEGSESDETSSTNEDDEMVVEQFLWNTVPLKMTRDPATIRLTTEGNIGSFPKLKETLKTNWISLNHFCNLPLMNFSQPLGFILRYNTEKQTVHVYIYISLLTNINQRRIDSLNEKLSHEKGILNYMSHSDIPISAPSVDSTNIMIHPYSIVEAKDKSKLDSHLILSSPLSDNIPSLMSKEGKWKDYFARGKYVASLLGPDEISNLICDISGQSEIQEIFENLPDDDEVTNMGDYLYGVLLYLNLCNYMNKKYNGFRSLTSYSSLFRDLNNVIYKKTDETISIPKHHITESNVVFISRLMFRYICPSLGIMILEGNGRNYSSCLAHCRCPDMNTFLNGPFDKKDALEDWNFQFISRQIPCDYVVHKFDYSRTSETPYKSLQKMYMDVSKRSYEDSQSSQQLSCREYADQFFMQFMDNPVEKSLHIPIEVRRKWSADFKTESNKFTEKEDKSVQDVSLSISPITGKRSKKRKSSDLNEQQATEKDWSSFAMNSWLLSKKAPFFKDFVSKKGLLQYVKPEYKGWFNNWRASSRTSAVSNEDDEFGDFLCKEMVENPTSLIFSNMNIIRMMSLYLCGLTCSDGNGDGELMTLLRKLVKTNGVYSRNEPPGNFTTTMKCPWTKKIASSHMVDLLGSADISYENNYKVRNYDVIIGQN